MIEAANRIRTKPYVWGGGHGRWWDEGYDCSGAVSYALRGAALLTSPLDSTGLMNWGEAEAGQWISVYANAGHTYAVIADLRWDTAGSASGTGPRWYADTRSAVSGRFVVRHPLATERSSHFLGGVDHGRIWIENFEDPSPATAGVQRSPLRLTLSSPYI